MFTVNRFCCLRLHTAGVVIGWIGLVLSLLNIITYIILITKIDTIITYVVDNSTSNSTDSKELALTGFSIYITTNIVDCVASILLIAGTVREKHLLLLPWLVNCGLSLTMNIVNFFAMIAFFILNSVSASAIIVFVVIVATLLLIQFNVWIAIHSLFKVIRLSAEKQRLLPNKSESGLPSYTRI